MQILDKRPFEPIFNLDLTDREKNTRMPADMIINLGFNKFVFNYERLVFIQFLKI